MDERQRAEGNDGRRQRDDGRGPVGVSGESAPLGGEGGQHMGPQRRRHDPREPALGSRPISPEERMESERSSYGYTMAPTNQRTRPASFDEVSPGTKRTKQEEKASAEEFEKLKADYQAVKSGQLLKGNVSNVLQQMKKLEELLADSDRRLERVNRIARETEEVNKEHEEDLAKRIDELLARHAKAKQQGRTGISKPTAGSRAAPLVISDDRASSSSVNSDMEPSSNTLPPTSSLTSGPFGVRPPAHKPSKMLGLSVEEGNTDRLRHLVSTQTVSSFLDPVHGGQARFPPRTLGTSQAARDSSVSGYGAQPRLNPSNPRAKKADCGIPGLVVDMVGELPAEEDLPEVDPKRWTTKAPADVQNGEKRCRGTLPLALFNQYSEMIEPISEAILLDETKMMLQKHGNFLFLEKNSKFVPMRNRGMSEVKHEVVSCIQCQCIERNRNGCTLDNDSREACWHCLKRKVPCSRMIRLFEKPDVFGMVFFPVPEKYREDSTAAEVGFWCRQDDEIALPGTPVKKKASRSTGLRSYLSSLRTKLTKSSTPQKSVDTD